MAWSSITELSTWRAAGLRPKETLERPRMSCRSGNSRRMSSIASRVHKASLRSSSLPVQIVKVSGSSSRSRLRQAEAAAGELDQAAGDPQLVLARLGHAGLVDGQRDHGRPELAGERHPGGRRRLAVLEIDRVQHGLAAVELERRLEHRQLGRIDHQRAVDLAAHARDHVGHLGHLVAADEGGADVERVAALAHLLAAHGDAAVPVAGRLQLAEFLRAVGVAALADRQERVLLAQRHGREQRGQRRRVLRRARARRRAEAVLGGPAQHGVQCADVLDRGAAAAADDVDRRPRR